MGKFLVISWVLSAEFGCLCGVCSCEVCCVRAYNGLGFWGFEFVCILTDAGFAPFWFDCKCDSLRLVLFGRLFFGCVCGFREFVLGLVFWGCWL